MDIAVFETAEWEHSACLRLQAHGRLRCSREPLDSAVVKAYADAEVISVFVDSRLTADVLEQLQSLRFIATRSTGYDHIDLDLCKRRGITVSNVPHYGAATVAEHVFALLLAIARNIESSVGRTRRGDFSRVDLRGFELDGKVLGVIGAGQIGRRVIQIGRGFGMRVLAFDARPDEGAADRLGFSYADLGQVLTDSDVVTLHVPGAAETVDLIGADELDRMKTGAVLINTSRGRVVNIEALVVALDRGKLRAVGLDVLPVEEMLRDEAEVFRSERFRPSDLRDLVAAHVLLKHRNAIVTAHNAYNTAEAMQRILGTTIENINGFVEGRAVNVVAWECSRTSQTSR